MVLYFLGGLFVGSFASIVFVSLVAINRCERCLFEKVREHIERGEFNDELIRQRIKDLN